MYISRGDLRIIKEDIIKDVTSTVARIVKESISEMLEIKNQMKLTVKGCERLLVKIKQTLCSNLKKEDLFENLDMSLGSCSPTPSNVQPQSSMSDAEKQSRPRSRSPKPGENRPNPEKQHWTPPDLLKPRQGTPETNLSVTVHPNDDYARLETKARKIAKNSSQKSGKRDGYHSTDAWNYVERKRRSRRSRRQDLVKRPVHEAFLKKCFRDEFRLSTSKAQRKDILSFQGALVATGYERVVVTFQGMYYEIHKNDIVFKSLEEKPSFDGSVKKWVTPGVTVFKALDENRAPTIKRHRFAMVPPDDYQSCFNPLRTDRFYIHVYQTRLDLQQDGVRTLKSKEIARELFERWPKEYFPRQDLEMSWLVNDTKDSHQNQRVFLKPGRREKHNGKSEPTRVDKTWSNLTRRRGDNYSYSHRNRDNTPSIDRNIPFYKGNRAKNITDQVNRETLKKTVERLSEEFRKLKSVLGAF